MNEKWYVAAKKADFQGIAKRFGIDPVTARIIRNRDVVGDDEIRQYLYGTRAELGDPAQLQGGLEAASLLKQKIEEGKKIRIIGDYDIDGVNSTYILYRALTRCGAQVDYEIPDRMKDGYGLNISLLKLALEEGIDTVLTCDNGISAIAEIAYAKENGMTVIVTDHHEPLFEEVPEEDRRNDTAADRPGAADSIPDGDTHLPPAACRCAYQSKAARYRYPYKSCAGAAVAWKICCLPFLYRLYAIEEEAEQFLQFMGFAVGISLELDGRIVFS